MASAEFGTRPGVHNTDYTYPTVWDRGASYTSPATLIAMGFNILRLPIRYERILRRRDGELSSVELGYIKQTVAEYSALGAITIIDVHDFGALAGQRLNKFGGDTQGTAASGTASTIILGAGTDQRSTVDGWMDGLSIEITGGTGSGQTRTITSYVGAYFDGGPTDDWGECAVTPNWTTAPDNTSEYTITGGGATNADLAYVWNKLSSVAEFKDNPLVHFDIMNEPGSMTAAEWFPALQAAITEIRDVVGASNVIHASGVGFGMAYTWESSGSAAEAVSITGNDVLWHMHQYFDAVSSGGTPPAITPHNAVQRVKNGTDWLKRNNKQGFLGEFGSDETENGRNITRAVLAHLQKNSDVWTGWTAWAAGPWWADGYFQNLDPVFGDNALEMLEDYQQYAQT